MLAESHIYAYWVDYRMKLNREGGIVLDCRAATARQGLQYKVFHFFLCSVVSFVSGFVINNI